MCREYIGYLVGITVLLSNVIYKIVLFLKHIMKMVVFGGHAQLTSKILYARTYIIEVLQNTSSQKLVVRKRLLKCHIIIYINKFLHLSPILTALYTITVIITPFVDLLTHQYPVSIDLRRSVLNHAKLSE